MNKTSIVKGDLPMNELIYKIETIVRNCGTQILQAKNEKMNIEKKEGIGNIVTEYDKKVLYP